MKRWAALLVVAAAVLLHLVLRHRPAAPPAAPAPAARADSGTAREAPPDSTRPVARADSSRIPRIAPLLVLATRIELPRLDVHPLTAPRAAAAGQKVPVQLTQYCLRGITRIGRPVAQGLVAADPRVFPLGRHVDLYIGGDHYGRFFVADIGRAVKGTVIDIWTPHCSDALRFGRKRGTAVLVPR